MSDQLNRSTLPTKTSLLVSTISQNASRTSKKARHWRLRCLRIIRKSSKSFLNTSIPATSEQRPSTIYQTLIKRTISCCLSMFTSMRTSTVWKHVKIMWWTSSSSMLEGNTPCHVRLLSSASGDWGLVSCESSWSMTCVSGRKTTAGI